MAVKIALAGNPNCGKTTLFNALTGSNQFVGNWPGVTVEKKEGKLKGHKDVVIMDLPGIYSLSPYTLEEVVARNYLIAERPDAILNIVDGTNIERNLYLSTQLMELGIPVIMAVNMMDVVEKSGEKIHTDKLSKKLGCEVVEISALKGTGIKEAAEKAVKLAESRKAAVVAHEFSKEAEDIIAEVEAKIIGMPEEQKRFFAIKLLEKDDKIQEMMSTVPDVSAQIKEMEDKFDDDTESVITNERYVYISSIIGECVTKNTKEKLTTSDKIDRIVTNRWAALPIFAVVMTIVYLVSVTTVGAMAFSECQYLETVRYGGKVISDRMFVRCTKLKNLTLTRNVKEIVGGCFNYCESLNQITYEGSLADWKAVKKNTNWDSHAVDIESPLAKIQCLDGYMEYDAGTKTWKEVKA